MGDKIIHGVLWPVRLTLPLMFIFAVLLVAVCAEGSDYYELLGVSREATTREIRQAFKKLALTMHPDKNPGDSSAHDKFLKVNRAYEVLKDEDLRKKYDKYGEKGLDEQQGGRYESWNYYRYDFGGRVLLSACVLEAAVNSGEIWFVNFYFPRCSHCHQLAPTWREFAKEMDGVIRIGAVNCGDNNHLCRRKGINSYPSLYIYRAGQKPEKFTGERNKDNLVRFSMQFITTAVTELWQASSFESSLGNVFAEIENAFSSGLGWLITFCSDTGGNSVSAYLLHVSTSLDVLTVHLSVQVGRVDCLADSELCQSLYIHKPCMAVFKGLGIHDFEIHHGKDVLYNIVGFARDSVRAHVTTLRPDNFPSNRKEPWLVDFFAPVCRTT
ncbi:hypothetical protein GOODEAATRI_014797 [Goodea atripinnis]|uniref:DnaJ homolog subfamily C member 10 n=1 Tax=Goodea atripinnis TaxID=208336 RepID=A0ABV0PY24_9TELE